LEHQESATICSGNFKKLLVQRDRHLRWFPEELSSELEGSPFD